MCLLFDGMHRYEYLRSIDGMVESIQNARNTPLEQGVSIDKLEW